MLKMAGILQAHLVTAVAVEVVKEQGIVDAGGDTDTAGTVPFECAALQGLARCGRK